jgi:Bystin
VGGRCLQIVPNLRNWEEVLFLTDVEHWSPHAVYQATRLFVSSMNAKMVRCDALGQPVRLCHDTLAARRLNSTPVCACALIEHSPAASLYMHALAIRPVRCTPGCQSSLTAVSTWCCCCARAWPGAAVPGAGAAAARAAGHPRAPAPPLCAVPGHEEGRLQAGGVLQGARNKCPSAWHGKHFTRCAFYKFYKVPVGVAWPQPTGRRPCLLGRALAPVHPRLSCRGACQHSPARK